MFFVCVRHFTHIFFYRHIKKIRIFLEQAICSSDRWYFSTDKLAHVTWTGKPPTTTTVILRQDVKAIVRSLFSETFILARAEVSRSLVRTNKAFCYRTFNNTLSQMKISNLYKKWMYYITLIIILIICSVAAYRFQLFILSLVA